MIYRPGCDESARDRNGNTDPENSCENGRNVDAPNAEINGIHCDFHNADRDNLPNPYYFQGSSDSDSLILHDRFNGQRYPDHKCEHDGQCDRPKDTDAKRNTNQKSGNFSDRASSQTVKSSFCGGSPCSYAGFNLCFRQVIEPPRVESVFHGNSVEVLIVISSLQRYR